MYPALQAVCPSPVATISLGYDSVAMTLNDILKLQHIDPNDVIVLRHRPSERQLRRALPWLAVEAPEVFNAYQQTQGPVVEKAFRNLENRGHVVSFLGLDAKSAVFVGLYRIGASKALTRKQYLQSAAYIELRKHGMAEFREDATASPVRWFDLNIQPFHSEWKGKLVITWPGLERSWYRRAANNEFAVQAILADSLFDGTMPAWDELAFTINELRVLPSRWRQALSHWRGIYYIRDGSDGKAYVGSAYGRDNLYGRWLGYSTSGHGGNRLLRPRDADNFTFTILQRVSPDMEAAEVIQLEASWKTRLHTRSPYGLNEN